MDTICSNHRTIGNASDAAAYRSAKPTAAAMKGWQTRKANLGQGLSTVPDPIPVYRTATTMTFGGTLPVPQTSVKEIERVPTF